MLVLVFALFSLFLMQVIANHLSETEQALEETSFYDPFRIDRQINPDAVLSHS
jgi:hypothetical protein